MVKRINFLFPECYVDTNILKPLFQLDGVNHQHSCSKVLSSMRSLKFKNEFAIGVVDDDKRKTYDYSDFRVLAKSDHLTLMKHNSRMHFLVFVSKAAEDLLLSCASELNIDMAIFNLPNDLEGLKSITKDCESDKEPRIKKLANALREASEMSRLQRTIKYLLDRQYRVDEAELIRLFDK